MKTITASVLMLFALSAGPAFSQVKYDAKVWRNVQTYDVRTLSKEISGHVRQLIGLRCNFRGKDIHHMKSNWYESSLWQPDTENKGKFSDVRVMVAKKDLNAFKALPIDSSAGEIVLYGRVEHDLQANFFFVRLIGSNATVDASGNATVSW